MTSRTRVVAAVVAVVMVVAAGASLTGLFRSGDGKPSASPSPSSATPSACALLDAKEREALAGAPVDTVTPIESAGDGAGSGGGAQCRWTSGGRLVQASTLTAPQWAETVPMAIDRLEKSGARISADDQRQIDRSRSLLKSAAGLTEEQACSLFSTLAEIGGAPKGSDTLVSYTQLTPKVLAVSAQTCRGGVFTSIVDAGPQLKQTDQLTKAAGVAVAAAHTRATAP
ncbi:hypothetical protein [Aeromicrobium sp.]|uniref:hypothetical protein n=1 Tax=Aeromicrobium sp. TaxID=1871063 RepID=UPI00199B76F8|nr:hypothetical protein [Aeromicrobium sp.]MBC7633876.1 hypothetical protein [Aeromicrobium sp.]